MRCNNVLFHNDINCFGLNICRQCCIHKFNKNAFYLLSFLKKNFYKNEFFLQIWCESTTEQTLLNDLLTDVHSPGKIRVLGTLSNSNEFAKAFRCPIGSPMNPSEKCKIW